MQFGLSIKWFKFNLIMFFFWGEEYMRIWGILMFEQFFEHWPLCKRCMCGCARLHVKCFLWFICVSFGYSLYVRSMFWKKAAKNVCNSLQMSRAENANRIIALHGIASPPKLSLAETSFALLHSLLFLSLSWSLPFSFTALAMLM